MLLELLITQTRSRSLAVGGIQCYLLDSSGNNAFSFLINDHHRIFTDAKLKTFDTSAQGVETLVRDATKTALSALQQMRDNAN